MRRPTRTLLLVALLALGAAVAAIALWPTPDAHSLEIPVEGGTLALDGPGWRLEPPERPEVVHLAFGTCRSTSDRAPLQVRTPLGVLHATGAFHASVERDGDRLRLRATSDGGVLHLDGAPVAPGQSIERPIRRGDSGDATPPVRLARIAGRVIDTDGEPAATRVRLVAAASVVAEVDTADDGSFAFDAVPDGRSHVVVADGPRVAVAPAASDATLRLGFATALQGVVVDAVGAPITGATVEVLATDGQAPIGWHLGRTATDAAGRFGIGGLPHMTVAIRVTEPGGESHTHLDVDLAGEPMLVTLRPLPRRTLRGVVRDDAGALRTARVTFDVAGHTIAEAEAASDGSFVVHYRVAGAPTAPTLPLRASTSNASGETAIAWARPPTEPIEIVVTPAAPAAQPAANGATRQPAVRRPPTPRRGAIRGRVDGAIGVGDARRVHAFAIGPVTRGVSLQDDDRFAIDELPEGRYRVVVLASDGSGATVTDVDVRPRASADVGLLRPSPGVVLRVTATDMDDASIAHDAILESLDAPDTTPVVGRVADGEWPTGTLAFGPVPPGRYRLRVLPRDRTRVAAEETLVLDTPETLQRVRCPRR